MEIGDMVTVRVKGEKLSLPCLDIVDGLVVVEHEGKTITRKPIASGSGMPKFAREMIAHAQVHAGRLVPGPDSPICAKCGLCDEAQTPYLCYSGSETPVITVVVESVSKKEESLNSMGSSGKGAAVKIAIRRVCEILKIGYDEGCVRVVALTRCASSGKTNYKTKGNWCRNFLVQDLREHPPMVIIAVGTAVLGSLCHKSSAPDWAGKVLTYRGWPDDWVTDRYRETDHPVLGKRDEVRIPVIPILNPGMVYAQQSKLAIQAWYETIATAIDVAIGNVSPPTYDRDYFEISYDPERVADVLRLLASRPGTTVTFDTEDTGLKQYKAGERIVFMMLRWDDEHGPRAFGFPWDYPESPLKPYLKELSEFVLRAIYASRIRGHNLTFDMLWIHSTLPEADLDLLANAMDGDTLNILYAMKQARGGHGLELVTYDWCPEMAGYEEEMTLLIARYPELLDPGAKMGGHYANALTLKDREPGVERAFTHYVMGDVESAHLIAERTLADLNKMGRYRIPVASLKTRGEFRWYSPPSRGWVYSNVLNPAARMLFKMMARGMYVDQDELATQESNFPKMLTETLAKVESLDPRITEWCARMRATEPEWELDLEKPDQLKEILFRILGCEVQRLTESGNDIYGDVTKCESRAEQIKYAAVDKYTLTRLISSQVSLKPLKEYKKLYKAYSGYVRPMRNAFLDGFDKHERNKEQHLMKDSCVHGRFMLNGTRGGRLSSADPNLQQLPKDGIVKRMYVSRFGARGCLYQGDLSQIELRLLAAACGDPTMVDAYVRDIDLHTLTTSRIFKSDYETYTKEHMAALEKAGRTDESHRLDMQRKIGKTTNFLTGYGGGPAGLQSSLAENGVYITIEEATDILEGFFDSYPTLRRYLDVYKKFMRSSGLAVSLTGRVREFPEIWGEDHRAINKALRAGCNHLIQSTASDMMLTALTAIEILMRDAGLESMLVSTVHDSLLIDTVRTELPRVHEICDAVLNDIPGVMESMFGPGYDLSWTTLLPFTGDFDLGLNYLDVIKVPKVPDWDELLHRLSTPALTQH